MDKNLKPKTSKAVLHLVKDEVSEIASHAPEVIETPKAKSAFARQLTSFADDLDAQIALLLSQ